MAMARKIGVVLAVVLVAGYLLLMRRGDIPGADAHRLVESGARLVDVRTREEFEAGHLLGAVNIPVQELDRRMVELEPKGNPVVLYCRSGNRSGRAARMLKSAGYSAVHDLGAMSRW
jgi:phage shock protein E